MLKSCLILIAIGLVLVTLMAYFTNRHALNTEQWIPPLPASHSESADPEEPKIILAWNSYWWWKDFQAGGFGRKPFLDQRCPVSNCYLTENRSRLAEASAVLFHARQIEDLPPARYPDQLYVFFIMESPYTTWKDFRNFTGVFNLTMTYRTDSDIPLHPYFMPSGVDSPYSMRYPLRKRRKSVVWVNSRCLKKSQRKNYVEELSKQIDVDVYGRCTESPERSLGCHGNQCFEETLPSMYKFFLSFENSFCLDYRTEKLYRTIQTEIIPVVYGGSNYTRDLPPHSFIDILDYDSPADLARYLKFLSKNETEYMRYFAWKGKHRLHSPFQQRFCRLCEIVHDPDFSKRYDDIASWWYNGTCTCEARVKTRYGFSCVQTERYADVSLSDITGA